MKRYRPERIGELLKEEVSQIISYELKDPQLGLVTITHVKVSRDLRHAKVYVSTLGTPEESRRTVERLNQAAAFIRRQLYPRLHLKTIPELVFHYDETIARAARIDDLLYEEKRTRGESLLASESAAEEPMPGADEPASSSDDTSPQ
ncbi:MAG: 30S ribosome-binding factor RbfA [Blastocatellia bacterium]|nr:30S ribosome-binding factor RbfA [Blastocatellia bacterium]MCS7157482.1 30S ribosome-binding factor RbfA [Blastocatellia bacterium]MCX7752655.1 30S ribosome-binding factor RbfA [Blastocatellia bacterium]MDW8168386.1 30S ribosome-binding factor RbfA [Acidobacteriota bacterium]MDW8255582.1 30S ribosome-binding factor RbfA [Acidobacteriota bacterium]